MATAPAALDAYREEADRFIAALDEEYYLHFAGLKESFELTPIYERYADVATLDACRRLAGASRARATSETSLARTGRRSRASRPLWKPRSRAEKSASACCVRRWRTSATGDGGSASTRPGSS